MLSTAPGCLVTDVPDYEEPVRPAPVLFSPSPPTTQFVRVLQSDVTFGAQLLSEDLGDDLDAMLLVNYGIATDADGAGGSPPTQLWRDVVGGSIVPPATLAGGPRTVEVTLQSGVLEPGSCNSVTLLVTHRRRGAGLVWCPYDSTDYAAITWWAVKCEDASNCPLTLQTTPGDGGCPAAGVTNFTYCEDVPPDPMQ